MNDQTLSLLSVAQMRAVLVATNPCPSSAPEHNSNSVGPIESRATIQPSYLGDLHQRAKYFFDA
jgi:hypothetical protein